jgi:hypothetical protein
MTTQHYNLFRTTLFGVCAFLLSVTCSAASTERSIGLSCPFDFNGPRVRYTTHAEGTLAILPFELTSKVRYRNRGSLYPGIALQMTFHGARRDRNRFGVSWLPMVNWSAHETRQTTHTTTDSTQLLGLPVAGTDTTENENWHTLDESGRFDEEIHIIQVDYAKVFGFPLPSPSATLSLAALLGCGISGGLMLLPDLDSDGPVALGGSQTIENKQQRNPRPFFTIFPLIGIELQPGVPLRFHCEYRFHLGAAIPFSETAGTIAGIDYETKSWFYYVSSRIAAGIDYCF